MNSILSFVLTLGILIFVHEFGHFILAKLFGVKVLKFSLGFGPKLVGKQIGDTEYLISAFPLGGYVKMLGEQPGDDINPEEKNKSFSLKPLWQRFTIVFGGPFSNLLFAVFTFFLIFAIMGLPNPVDSTKIGAIAPDSPAEQAGLLADDVILSINDVKTEHWIDISNLIKDSKGQPVVLEIRRGTEILQFIGTPKEDEIKNLFGEVVEKRYLLGITRPNEVVYEKASIFEALGAGFTQTWSFIYLTILGIVKIIQKVVPASELGGPILIAQIAGQQMEAGWISLLYFMGLLSVNLGILNLFPIPMLDGGHLAFYTMEAVRRKPLSLKTQEMFQQVGLVLLISLMIFVFYNDLARIFMKG
jgi:regulator of sigma E protease